MTERPQSRVECYLQLSFFYTVVNKSRKEDERRKSISCCGSMDVMASSTVLLVPVLNLILFLLFVFVVLLLLLLFDTPSKPVNNETWCASSSSGVAVNVIKGHHQHRLESDKFNNKMHTLHHHYNTY
jgi:hypothetical protein